MCWKKKTELFLFILQAIKHAYVGKGFSTWRYIFFQFFKNVF